MPEVRPTLLDDLYFAAGRRPGDPGSTGQDVRFLNWLGRHAMKVRPEFDDEDDEVFDDEDFDTKTLTTIPRWTRTKKTSTTRTRKRRKPGRFPRNLTSVG
jgi:hypothetical protein